jgi:hypothetical protein
LALTLHKWSPELEHKKGAFMNLTKTILSIALVVSSYQMTNADTLTSGTTKIALSKMNISGPRLGLTSVVNNGSFGRALSKYGINNVYSQFGWHFEAKVAPEGYHPSFVFECIPLIGALEYDVLIPSVTFPMGIRFPNGFEIGLGPNIVVGYPNFSTSIVLAFGQTINVGGIGVPINMAICNGKGGTAVSVLMGYAIVKSKEAAIPMN